MSTGMIGEIVVLTSRLVEVLEREVAGLRRGDVSIVGGLQAEKQELARSYEIRMGELKKQPALFASVAPAIQDELQEAVGRLQRTIRRNSDALAAAEQATRRLMEMILQAAATERQPAHAYAASGHVGRARMATVALDQRL